MHVNLILLVQYVRIIISKEESYYNDIITFILYTYNKPNTMEMNLFDLEMSRH